MLIVPDQLKKMFNVTECVSETSGLSFRKSLRLAIGHRKHQPTDFVQRFLVI